MAFMGADFVPQQNTQINSTNWVDMKVLPTVTNGQTRMILTAPLEGRFFRLRSFPP
jgi:hypothetical protein